MWIMTQRLLIRRFVFDDWRGLQRIVRDFQASEYRYLDREIPTEDAKIKGVARYAAGPGLWFSVVLDGEMIGYVCFHGEGDAVDMGYCFHSSAHGKGYAFESCSALMEMLASALGRVRFTAGTALDNAPSMRLLARLGFVPTGQEKLCFHEGHPFTGCLFEKIVDGAQPQ